jgi:hypothetical protein
MASQYVYNSAAMRTVIVTSWPLEHTAACYRLANCLNLTASLVIYLVCLFAPKHVSCFLLNRADFFCWLSQIWFDSQLFVVNLVICVTTCAFIHSHADDRNCMCSCCHLSFPEQKLFKIYSVDAASRKGPVRSQSSACGNCGGRISACKVILRVLLFPLSSFFCQLSTFTSRSSAINTTQSSRLKMSLNTALKLPSFCYFTSCKQQSNSMLFFHSFHRILVKMAINIYNITQFLSKTGNFLIIWTNRHSLCSYLIKLHQK